MRVGDGLVSFIARRPPASSEAAIEIMEKQGEAEIEIRK